MLSKADTTYEYDTENHLTKVTKPRPQVHDTFNIPLKQGWNFISLPCVPDGYNVNDDIPIEAALSSLTFGTDYSQLSRYDPVTNKFESYCNDPQYNQFSTMKYLRGYQIYCLRNCTLTITGSSPSTPYTSYLSAGVNLIGVDITSNGKTVSAAFFNIAYISVKWYNPDTKELITLKNTDTVELGKAYYAECSSDSTYQVSSLSEITTFTYDGDGGRVTRTQDTGRTTVFIGSLFEIEQGTQDAGRTTRHIFLGNTRICSVDSEGGWFFCHGDHLGSSSDITNGSGTLIQHTEYKPYGEESITPKTFGDTTDYLFTGKLLDKSSGLYYYGARYYDPELGRFTQPDTIVPQPSNPQSLNRYSYCDNNPINYTDPTGHFKFKDLLGHIVGGIVGAAAGILTGNPAIGISVYSAISSGITAAQAGSNVWEAVGIGALSGFSSFFVAGGIMSALGNPAWAIPYAAAAGGAAGGIVGSALSGGNIGQAAAAGAVGGAIGSVMPIIGPMIGSGVASEMVGGNFLEGAAQGAACVISSAIASGALQTAIDYGQEKGGVEGSAGTSRTISEQLIRPPSTYNVSRVNGKLFGDLFRSDLNSLIRLQLMVIKSALVGIGDTVTSVYTGVKGIVTGFDKVETTLKATTGKGILGHIEDFLESHSYQNNDTEQRLRRFPPFI